MKTYHFRSDYDWFLKADDDTYVVVENLRFMLEPYNSSDPIYFGCKFKPFVRQGYMSGGAGKAGDSSFWGIAFSVNDMNLGYVLSREAVKRFVEKGIDHHNCRKGHGGAEDVEIGKCLAEVNVIAGDSRDAYGRGR